MLLYANMSIDICFSIIFQTEMVQVIEILPRGGNDPVIMYS